MGAVAVAVGLGIPGLEGIPRATGEDTHLSPTNRLCHSATTLTPLRLLLAEGINSSTSPVVPDGAM